MNRFDWDEKIMYNCVSFLNKKIAVNLLTHWPQNCDQIDAKLVTNYCRKKVLR